VIACDYFLDALADPEFALKIRERHPEDLDLALRIALQLEVWTKDSARLRQNERYEAKKTREVTGPKTTSQGRINEALRNEVDEQRKKITELEQQLAKRPAPRPLAEATNNQRMNCWRCGGAGHISGIARRSHEATKTELELTKHEKNTQEMFVRIRFVRNK